jgi:hypothetical protein
MKQPKTLLVPLLFWATLIAGNAPAQESEALRVHHQSEDLTHSAMIDDIHRISFTEDNHLVLKSLTAEKTTHFDDIQKLTFGEYIVSGGTTAISETLAGLDVAVYISPNGEIRVESAAAVKKLSLFSIVGRLENQSHRSTISAGHLPAGVYLLHIETEQGNITKKIIKQ